MGEFAICLDLRQLAMQLLKRWRTAVLGEPGRTNKTSPRRISVMAQWINGFVRDEEGQDLVEYAMLLAFIALIAIVGVKALGNKVNTFFSNVATALGS